MPGIRSILAVVLVPFVLVHAAPLTAQSRGMGRLTGTVVSESGEPIAGATIRIPVVDGTLQQETDGNGNWNFMGIGKGEFSVEVSKAGFQSRRLRVVVERETMQSTPVKIALKKA